MQGRQLQINAGKMNVFDLWWLSCFLPPYQTRSYSFSYVSENMCLGWLCQSCKITPASSTTNLKLWQFSYLGCNSRTITLRISHTALTNFSRLWLYMHFYLQYWQTELLQANPLRREMGYRSLEWLCTLQIDWGYSGRLLVGLGQVSPTLEIHVFSTRCYNVWATHPHWLTICSVGNINLHVSCYELLLYLSVAIIASNMSSELCIGYKGQYTE